MTHIERFFTNERAILVAIAVNAIVLCLLSFPTFETRLTLDALDYAFTVFFLIEALVKIRALSFPTYFRDNWNRFDLIIVLVSLPSLLLVFTDVPDLSFVLLLRVLRVFKFFRFIKFVPNMSGLIDGVVRALKASVFVMLAFFTFNFVISLLSCHLFRDRAPELFGNPAISFYSIFKVFTVEGWYEIPDQLAIGMSAGLGMLTRVYFMAIVASGGLFGLSLVNAIFVDEMLRNESEALEVHLQGIDSKLDMLLADRAERLAVAEGPGDTAKGAESDA